MARPRKPVSTKLLAGTYRSDRQPKDSAERLAKPPRPPRNLSTRAAKEWKALAPVAVALGTLRAADLRAFRLLAETLATASEAAEIVAREGYVIATKEGSKKSPLAGIMETSRAQAKALLVEFGLTPRGRQHVDAVPPEKAPAVGEDDPFAKIRALRGGKS